MGLLVVVLGVGAATVGSARGLAGQVGGGPLFGVAEDAPLFASDGGAADYASLLKLGMGEDRLTVLYEGDSSIKNQTLLDAAVAAAKTAGVNVILSLYQDPSGPSGAQAAAPGAFCQWVGTVAARYPSITDFIIGNEVNTTRFWSPQHTPADQNAGADGYEALLAQCYDTLKGINPNIQVIGMGLSPRAVDSNSTAPLTFIREVGAAYKASGRTRPIMDKLGVHPYPDPNANPPWPPLVGYQNVTFYGIWQLDRVKQAVYDAFNGTAQPTTLTGLRLVVDEIGYQSNETGNPLYTGVESSPTVSEATQASYYALIVRIYECDPSVSSVLFFHLVDETNLNVTPTSGGWQSGLEHPDGSPKPSYTAVQQAISGGCLGPQVTWTPVSGPLKATVVRVSYTHNQYSRYIGIELKTGTITQANFTLIRGSQALRVLTTFPIPAGDRIIAVPVPNTYAPGPATVGISLSDNFGRTATLRVNVVVPAKGTTSQPTTGTSGTTTASSPAPVPTPAPQTFSETVGGVAHTWTNYTNAGGTEGPSIAANQIVQIACKVTGFKVADGDTWWYRIAQSPWNNQYYVSADAFYNNGNTSGSLIGTPFVDPAVPDCGAAPTTPTPSPSQPFSYAETVGGAAHTWTNYTNAGGTEGPSIAANQTVQIACKVTGFKVSDGDSWWYRIAGSPWNNQYYVSADAFYNNGRTSGSLIGTPFVDSAVPECPGTTAPSTAATSPSTPSTATPAPPTSIPAVSPPSTSSNSSGIILASAPLSSRTGSSTPMYWCITTDAVCTTSFHTLDPGTKLAMYCWMGGRTPQGYQFGRWFYIRASTGYVGFVKAEQVAGQTTTPNCSTKPNMMATLWALSKYGQLVYYQHGGQCLAFMSDAYTTGAGSSFPGPAGADVTAWQWLNAQPGFTQHERDVNPPPGALVFWKPDAYSEGAGHVALSIGNGWVVSSYERGTYTIHLFAIADRNQTKPYFGWYLWSSP
jgi:hypothetical protein